MAKPKAETQVVKLDERGQLSIYLDAEYVLRPSVEAIIAIERQTAPLVQFDLATLAANCRMSLEHMAICVAEFMRAHGKANPDDPLKTTYLGAKPETLAGLIMEAGAPRICGALAVILAGSLNGGYTAAGEAKAAGTK
jgi:hypothetical protein